MKKHFLALMGIPDFWDQMQIAALLTSPTVPEKTKPQFW